MGGVGRKGPSRGKPGLGGMGGASGGLGHRTGRRGGVPGRVGVSIGDTLAVLDGVICGLLALRNREVNGGFV